MVRSIRYLIAIALLIYAISIFKAKGSKTKIIKAIMCIFGFFIILIMPFENLFLKFDTPEQAFNYGINNCTIIKTVESEQSALVIYNEKGSTYSTLISRCNNKWKASFFPDDQILSRLGNNERILITKERNSNNFYVMITVNTDIKLVTDNQDSNFEVFLQDDYWTNYVTYVNNYKGDYIINVDGDQYKIEI